MIGSLVTGVSGLLFPMFASYRALISNDISLIRPWLMYWVVFATLQFAESAVRPILNLLPFYGFFKAGLSLWLVLPQTQGAIQLYQTHLEPWLRSHNQQIDETVNSAVNLINSTPLAPLLRFVLPSSGRGGAGAAGAASSDATSGRAAGSAPNSAAASGAQGGVLDSILSSFRQTSSPDANLSAYLPAILGGGSGSATPGEGYAAVRNRLLGLVRSLDSSSAAANTSAGSSANSASASTTINSAAASGVSQRSREPDAESFDFVEMPRDNTPATEIEREVQKGLH